MMTCDDYRRGLERLIEERETADRPALEQHGLTCGDAGCRRAWEEHVVVEHAVCGWGSPGPSGSLAERVCREVGGIGGVVRPARQSAGRSRRLLAALAGTAAALVLLIGVLTRSTPRSAMVADAKRTTEPVGVRGSGDSPAVGDADGIGEEEQPGPDVSFELAQGATEMFTDLALLMVPGEIDPGEANESGPGWMRRLGARIEPMTEDVSTKLDEWFGPST